MLQLHWHVHNRTLSLDENEKVGVVNEDKPHHPPGTLVIHAEFPNCLGIVIQSTIEGDSPVRSLTIRINHVLWSTWSRE